MDLFGTILLWISGVLIIFLLIGGIFFYLDKHSESKFFCNILKWHKDPKWQDSNGFDYYGTCPRCGNKVYQDEWGTWDTRKEEFEDQEE